MLGRTSKLHRGRGACVYRLYWKSHFQSHLVRWTAEEPETLQHFNYLTFATSPLWALSKGDKLLTCVIIRQRRVHSCINLHLHVNATYLYTLLRLLIYATYLRNNSAKVWSFLHEHEPLNVYRQAKVVFILVSTCIFVAVFAASTSASVKSQQIMPR